MNVYCVIRIASNVLEVYKEYNLVAVVSEGVNGPELTVYGNTDSLRVLTFNDLDIIMDNWNQMQELRAEQRGERIVKILKEELAKK